MQVRILHAKWPGSEQRNAVNAGSAHSSQVSAPAFHWSAMLVRVVPAPAFVANGGELRLPAPSYVPLSAAKVVRTQLSLLAPVLLFHSVDSPARSVPHWCVVRLSCMQSVHSVLTLIPFSS